MVYYIFVVDDSGAIENSKNIIIKNKEYLVCDMYNHKDFNSANDILHTIDNNGFMLNSKAFKLFEKLHLPYHTIKPAIVKRKINFLKLPIGKMQYNYNYIELVEDRNLLAYNWIDFVKSEIVILKGKKEYQKLTSHQERFEFIEKNNNLRYNESFSFVTKKIVFNKNFDNTLDLFRIPYYSSGTYVSEKFKALLLEHEITDIKFAESEKEIRNLWKPYYPQIIFEK